MNGIFCKHDYAQKTLNYLDKLKKCLLLEELDLNFVWIRNERDVSEFLFPFCNYFPLMYTIGVGYYDFPERKYKNLINAYTLNKKNLFKSFKELWIWNSFFLLE